MPLTRASPPISSLAIHSAIDIGNSAQAPTTPMRVAMQAITNANTNRINPRFCMTVSREERLEEALQQIVAWSDAYPDAFFPVPDLAKARELLAAGGITLDAVSAHAMRHVIEGVGKIARQALEP